MKDLIKLAKSNASARMLMFFSLILFAGTTMSRTIHAIWFEEQGNIENFGLAYSAMAIAGALSFFSGILTRKLGIVNAIKIGTFIYSIGMAMRIFTDSAIIAIISGFISGLGASIVFVNLQPWIASWSKEDEQTLSISLNQTSSVVGNAIGSLLITVGMTVFFTFLNENTFILLLLISSIFPILASFFIKNSTSENLDVNPLNKEKVSYKQILLQNKFFVGGIVFLSILGGLYSSILTPFIPLIMKSSGLNVAKIGLTLTFLTIVIAIINPTIASFIKNKSKIKTLAFSEFILSILVFTLLFTIEKNISSLLIIVLLFRGVAITISVIAEQSLQMGIFKGSLAPVLFGMVQSSFWVGDSIGAMIGGVIYANMGVEFLVLIGGSLILINSLICPLFYYLVKKSTLQNKLLLIAK